MAELWGILTALNLARERGISQLWIESDSLDAVQSSLSRDLCNQNPCIAPIIHSIAQLMRGNWKVRISHGFREGNRLADFLATYAHTTEVGLHVLDVPPPRCIKILTEDVAGVFRRRSVCPTNRVGHRLRQPRLCLNRLGVFRRRGVSDTNRGGHRLSRARFCLNRFGPSKSVKA